jgi:predicted phage terminase large subunit-like protein
LINITLEDVRSELRRRKPILDWGKTYFPDMFSKEFCEELHNYLVDIRFEEFTSTLAPRSHAKTTIKCFLIPIYIALNEPKKYLHYLNIQNTTSKAISINLNIRRELELNELLIKDYGLQVTSEKWTEKQFVLRNGVIFTSIGSGESVRGLNYKAVRPDYIVLDDIYDDDDIHNMKRIDKKESWFWSSIYPARSQTKETSIHVQGTAISKKDLMHKLESVDGVKYKKFVAIIDNDLKKTLWFDYDTLIVDKGRMGSIIFSREMQNDVRDDETSIIRESFIKYYDTLPPAADIKWARLGVDPAIGEKAINDCTGKALVYKDKNENFYIDMIWNDRFSFNANIEHMIALYSRYKFAMLKLEGISAFQALGQEIKRKTSIPLKMITSVKDKISRLEAQSSKFENGKVFINRRIPRELMNELIEQLINNFPDHDDIRDAIILTLEDDVRQFYIGVA